MPAGVGATRPACNSTGLVLPLLPSGTVRVLSGSGEFNRQQYRRLVHRAVSGGYRVSRQFGEGAGNLTVRNVAATCLAAQLPVRRRQAIRRAELITACTASSAGNAA